MLIIEHFLLDFNLLLLTVFYIINSFSCIILEVGRDMKNVHLDCYNCDLYISSREILDASFNEEDSYANSYVHNVCAKSTQS